VEKFSGKYSSFKDSGIALQIYTDQKIRLTAVISQGWRIYGESSIPVEKP
jgi:hypothetical protein